MIRWQLSTWKGSDCVKQGCHLGVIVDPLTPAEPDGLVPQSASFAQGSLVFIGQGCTGLAMPVIVPERSGVQGSLQR